MPLAKLVLAHAKGATFNALHIVQADLTGWTLSARLSHAGGVAGLTATLVPRSAFDPFWYESQGHVPASVVQVALPAAAAAALPTGFARYDIRAAKDAQVALFPITDVKILERITDV